MKTFHVLEPHVDGTKQYAPGDEREADENEVRQLVELGVLSTTKPKVPSEKAEKAAAEKAAAEKAAAEKAAAEKAAQPPLNKMQPAPENKGV